MKRRMNACPTYEWCLEAFGMTSDPRGRKSLAFIVEQSAEEMSVVLCASTNGVQEVDHSSMVSCSSSSLVVVVRVVSYSR